MAIRRLDPATEEGVACPAEVFEFDPDAECGRAADHEAGQQVEPQAVRGGIEKAMASNILEIATGGGRPRSRRRQRSRS